jgi:hypothetical protein
MSRLFGAVDSEEVREAKMGELEQRINQGSGNVKAAQENLRLITVLISVTVLHVYEVTTVLEMLY